MIPESLQGISRMFKIKIKVTLDSGSTTKQGIVMRGGKKIVRKDEYRETSSICLMNEEDMKFIGVVESGNVKLETDVGSVVLKVVKGDCPRGLVFVPKGPWVNSVIDADTFESGSPHFKGMTAEVQATDKRVLEVDELLRAYKPGE